MDLSISPASCLVSRLSPYDWIALLVDFVRDAVLVVEFLGRDARGERPAAVSIEAARTHLGLLGGTGSGKSAVMCRIALDLLALGYGAIVIDPKADLVAELLERVPAGDADRVGVLDPAASGPLPGLDL
jgi:hypothetical protein